jgi:arabinofuranan 3-O-arabinosyltransferase
MQILRYLLQPSVRWVICWLILLVWAGATGVAAWTAFNEAGRADGNRGHATIDFGGQWLMGRMIVEGQGRHLYLRNYLRSVARRSYPAGVESPKENKSDAESLMEWLAGTDDPKTPEAAASLLAPLAANNPLGETAVLTSAQTIWTEERLEHITAPRIGGALYPPIHALYYAPLALLRPPVAYRVMQGLVLALVFFIGWVAQRMTEGRVWWPVASLFVLMFPGFAGCITLGQNGILLLTLVLVGWWQLSSGEWRVASGEKQATSSLATRHSPLATREVLAGLCWGLLAFKPVWAAAFFLVPLLTTRWRMAVSMAVAGIVQIAVTLPVVGWDSWRNWLQVGQEAVQEYKRQENWVVLSRDLLGIPRRWLVTYEDGLAKDVVWRAGNPSTTEDSGAENPWDHPLPAVLGWGLWAAVLAGTLLVVWRCRQQRKELTGLFPAFVLMAAVLTCYHFMYYDFVIAGLPVLLLFAEPRRYLQWRVRAFVPPLVLFLMLTAPALSSLCDPSYHFPPWETFVLLLLWGWCGYCLLKNPVSDASQKRLPLQRFCEASLTEGASTPKLAELGADVRGAHERFADQHGTDAGRL